MLCTYYYNFFLKHERIVTAKTIHGMVIIKLFLQETQVWSLGLEDPLEKRMATHSSILTWRIPWTEEPGGLSDPTERLMLPLPLCSKKKEDKRLDAMTRQLKSGIESQRTLQRNSHLQWSPEKAEDPAHRWIIWSQRRLNCLGKHGALTHRIIYLRWCWVLNF